MKRFGTAIILAGGKSQRMGFDKQKVCIGGVSMVNYIAKQLESEFEQIIIVSNTPNYYSPTSYEIYADIHKHKGPMAGIYVGLTHAISEYAYVVAGDMPMINIEYIQWMKDVIIKRYNRTMKPPFACITKLDHQLEPFNGFYSQEGITDIEACIHKDHLKITRLVAEKESLIIDETRARQFSKELEMFTNLNTLEKLKSCTRIKESITIIA